VVKGVKGVKVVKGRGGLPFHLQGRERHRVSEGPRISRRRTKLLYLKVKVKGKNMSRKITVGLFGTCGGSQWREPFLETCEGLEVEVFNPVVPEWDPSFAVQEAEHLVNDDIILFPVTEETYDEGSLAETGYSISQALRSNKGRYVVVYVAPQVHREEEDADKAKATTSNKMRALVLAHLKRQRGTFPNVFVVESLDEMHRAMIHLIAALKIINQINEMK